MTLTKLGTLMTTPNPRLSNTTIRHLAVTNGYRPRAIVEYHRSNGTIPVELMSWPYWDGVEDGVRVMARLEPHEPMTLTKVDVKQLGDVLVTPEDNPSTI